MASVVETMICGRWPIQCGNQQFIKVVLGSNDVTTVADPTRAATLRAVRQSQKSAEEAIVLLRDGESEIYLAIDSKNRLVGVKEPASASAFLLRQVGLTSFTLSSSSADPNSYVAFDAKSGHFVSGQRLSEMAMFNADHQKFNSIYLWNVNFAQGLVGPGKVGGGALLVASRETLVKSIDVMSGMILWVGPSGQATCPVEIDMANSLVLVASPDALLALKSDTGTIAWKVPLSGDSVTHLTQYGDRLFAVTANRRLIAYDITSGKWLWSYALNGAPGGALVAPVAFVDSVYVAPLGGDVVALNTETGAVLWSDTSGHRCAGGLAVDGQHLYFSAAQSVVALDRANGVVAWSGALDGSSTAPPLISEDKLFVASSSGAVMCLKAEDGEVVWRQKTSHSFACQPARIGRFLGVNTREGLLLSLDASNGQVLNDYDLASPLESSLVAFSGAYYLVSDSESFIVSLTPDLSPAFLVSPSSLTGLATMASFANTYLNQKELQPADWQSFQESWDVRWIFHTDGQPIYSSGALLQPKLAYDESLPDLVGVLCIGVHEGTFYRYINGDPMHMVDILRTIVGPDAPSGIQVNGAAMESYRGIGGKILDAVRKVKPTQLVVTAFNGAGMIASLAALELAVRASDGELPFLNPEKITLVTFGAPPVGNQKYADYFARKMRKHLQVINSGSAVFRLLTSAAGYVPTGETIPVAATQMAAAPFLNADGLESYLLSLSGRR